MKKDSLLSSLLIVAGFALAAYSVIGLRSDERLAHSRNPFAIQRSAYGKLFARLSETTVDRVWHLGVEQVVPHYMSGHKHDPKEDHAHSSEEHHDHDHDHAEHDHAEHDHAEHDHAEHDHCGHEHCGHDHHDHEHSRRTARKSGIDKGKRWIQDRVIAQHTRTNPHSLSEQHLSTVYKEIEELLLRSFKMDPTHYGAYDSYHLFLTTTSLGGTPGKERQARLIARAAMAAARGETEDPEPWLTAAAAGMNLYLMDAAPYMSEGEPIPLDILKKYREQIGYCLARFGEVQEKSEKAGIWDNLSMERQMEIAERSRFVSRTFEQFDVMIARAESRKSAPSPEGEVAGTEAEPDEEE